LLNDFLLPSLDGKIKKAPSNFFIFFKRSIEIFWVARHFPTTFGENIASRLLYDFPRNYPTWPCMEKHNLKKKIYLLENEKENN